MARQDGYYWVKYFGDWQIGRFSKDRWYLTYDALDGDSHFSEINESRILSPDEPVVTSEMYLNLQKDFAKSGLPIPDEEIIIHNQTPPDYFKELEDSLRKQENKDTPRLAILQPENPILIEPRKINSREEAEEIFVSHMPFNKPLRQVVNAVFPEDEDIEESPQYNKIKEHIFKRLRSIADHCEIGIEFKSDVNGQYFDIDKELLDKV